MPTNRLSSASHAPGASIENGNTLGQRPVVRQSKLYRKNESGNAMKAAMGYDDLQWDTEALEGVFAGQGLYDAEHEKVVVSGTSSRDGAAKTSASKLHQRRPQSAGRNRSTHDVLRPAMRDQPPLDELLPPRRVAGARHAEAVAAANHPASSGGYFFTVGGADDDELSTLPPPRTQTAEAEVEDDPRSALERMRELKARLDDGLISHSEFDARRTAILDAL